MRILANFSKQELAEQIAIANRRKHGSIGAYYDSLAVELVSTPKVVLREVVFHGLATNPRIHRVVDQGRPDSRSLRKANAIRKG